ncbi:unnamed protein product [Gongylonema pulchrum]|uniref:Ricin B-type lectin domain-containing protein n=1 Tax=Gongylonema pulchrum TaxID=637853 RepID=A0A183E9G7_9BILA|nr:unnamed protein product [Gongylonema pulchrum]
MPLNSQSCAEKELLLDPRNNQQIELRSNTDILNNRISSCFEFQRNNISWYQCDGNRRFISKRARWWFIALGNCNSTIGVDLEFDFLMTNGAPNSIWFYHFSADEFCECNSRFMHF